MKLPHASDCTAACMLASIQVASNQLDKVSEAKNAVVHARVHLGEPKGRDGYGLEVEIEVEGVGQDLIDAGHKVRSLLLRT